VLQVAVRQPASPQTDDHLDEASLELGQRSGRGQSALHGAVERDAIQPGHLGHGVPGLADAHADRQVGDRHERLAERGERLADGRVAPRPVGGVAVEAAHRPALAATA
jgi:hypothetical protein